MYLGIWELGRDISTNRNHTTRFGSITQGDEDLNFFGGFFYGS